MLAIYFQLTNRRTGIKVAHEAIAKTFDVKNVTIDIPENLSLEEQKEFVKEELKKYSKITSSILISNHIYMDIPKFLRDNFKEVYLIVHNKFREYQLYWEDWVKIIINYPMYPFGFVKIPNYFVIYGIDSIQDVLVDELTEETGNITLSSTSTLYEEAKKKDIKVPEKYLNNKEVKEWYRKADKFYYFRKYETWGFPIMEAYLNGLEVIMDEEVLKNHNMQWNYNINVYKEMNKKIKNLKLDVLQKKKTIREMAKYYYPQNTFIFYK